MNGLKVAVAIGASLTILSCLGVVAYFLTHKKRRRHPFSLVLTRSILDLIWAVTVLTGVSRTSSDYTRDDNDATCDIRAFVFQFCITASELWGLSLSYDILSALKNPFTSFSTNFKRYLVVIPALSLTGAIYLTESKYHGPTPFRVCWVTEAKIGSGLNYALWGLFYVPIMAMYLFSLFVLVYAGYWMQRGKLKKTQTARKLIFLRERNLVLGYTVYWTLTAVLYGLSVLQHGKRDDDYSYWSSDSRVAQAFCVFFLGKGAVTLVILLINQHITYNTVSDSDDGATFNPQLNEALQEEVKQYIIIALRLSIEQSPEFSEHQSAMLGDTEWVPVKLVRVRHRSETVGDNTAGTASSDTLGKAGSRTSRESTSSLRQGLLPHASSSATVGGTGAGTGAGAGTGTGTGTGAAARRRPPVARETSLLMAQIGVRTVDAHELLPQPLPVVPDDEEVGEQSSEVAEFTIPGDKSSGSFPMRSPLEINTRSSTPVDLVDRHQSGGLPLSPSGSDHGLFSDDSRQLSGSTRTIEHSLSVGGWSIATPFLRAAGKHSGAGPQLEIQHLSPDLFAEVRALNGIKADHFLYSVGKTVKHHFSEGASGAFLCFSRDSKYVIKTASYGDIETLQDILPAYVRHLRSNPDSLICKFYACIKMKLYTHTLYFLVMENIFQTQLRIDSRYDLKGSWVNRSAKTTGQKMYCRHCQKINYGNRLRNQTLCRSSPTNRHQYNVVLKDNDLHYKLSLQPEYAARLSSTLKADVRFLASQGIMDYSLLVGVHEQTFEVDRQQLSLSEDMLTPRRKSMSEDPTMHESYVPPPVPFYRSDQGGIVPARYQGPAVFYVGLIDVLQRWNMTKRLERWAKVNLKCQDAAGISAAPPLYYRQRFEENVIDIVVDGADDESKDAAVF